MVLASALAGCVLLSVLVTSGGGSAAAVVDPGSLSDGEYFRPTGGDVTGATNATGAAWRRSPCPAINTLANHGFLPRDGKNVAKTQLVDAIVARFSLEKPLVDFIASLVPYSVFSLDQLSEHNRGEHDMSMVHADAFVGEDPASTNGDLVADLFARVGASDTMDTLFFAKLKKQRLDACYAQNPTCSTSPLLGAVSLGEPGLLMRSMGGQNAETISVADARSFLVDEKFPAAFTKAARAVSQADTAATRAQISLLYSAAGDWLVRGFAAASQPVLSNADPTLCLEIQDASTVSRAPLQLGGCDASKANQRFAIDANRRLVVEHTGLCMDVFGFDASAGAEVVQTACNDKANQKWSYDASGRLRPLHAPAMCLTPAGSALVLGNCSAQPQQAFFSEYKLFEAKASRLMSMSTQSLCLGVAAASSNDLATVEAAGCDLSKNEQKLSLDASQRLVFQHSGKCLSANTGGGASILQRACDASATQQWFYDSLGRLRSRGAPTLCVSLTATVSMGSAVVLANCSDASAQFWFAADMASPQQALDVYYRPSKSEGSAKPGTKALYRRSPCPAINALANQGYLPRDGKSVAVKDLARAVATAFKLEAAVVDRLLQVYGYSSTSAAVISLDALSVHGQFEYDGSLVHADAYFGNDPMEIDAALAVDLFARVDSSESLDLASFAATIRRRAAACTASNPQCSLPANEDLKLLKPALLLRSLGQQGGDIVLGDFLQAFLVSERFPLSEAYLPPSTDITLADLQATTATLQQLVKANNNTSTLVQPFAPANQSVASGVDAAFCLDVQTAASRAPLVVTRCAAASTSQKLAFDAQQRLVVQSTGLCVDVFGGGHEEGAKVVQTACNDRTNQKWLYDASGRLHPQHAPEYCLTVQGGVVVAFSPVVLGLCDQRREQTFVASAAFQPTKQQLLSLSALVTSPACLAANAADGSVALATCDASQPSQLMTLDAQRRLVVAGGDCLAASGSADAVVAAVCSADAAQQWTYDSLGRVHALGAAASCLTRASGSSALHVTFCGASDAQKWLVV